MFLEREMDKTQYPDPLTHQVVESPSAEGKKYATSGYRKASVASVDMFSASSTSLGYGRSRDNNSSLPTSPLTFAEHQSVSKPTEPTAFMKNSPTSNHSASPGGEAGPKFGVAGSTPLPHLPLRKQASKKLRSGLMRHFSRSRKDSPTSPRPEVSLPLELAQNARQVSEQQSDNAPVARRDTTSSTTRTDSDRDSIQISPRQSQLFNGNRDRTTSDASSILPSPTAPSKPPLTLPEPPPPPAQSTSSRPTTTTSVFTDSSTSTRMTVGSSTAKQQAPNVELEDKSRRQSSMTNGSSNYGERNSVRTSKSSNVDASNNSRPRSSQRDDDEGEMSVEDAIMMYAEGFEDDPQEEEDVPPVPEVPKLSKIVPPPLPPPPATEMRRDSDTLPSTTSIHSADSLPSPPLSPLPAPGLSRSKSSAVRTSAQIIAGQFFPDSPKSSRPSSPSSPKSPLPAPRDRYGFKKESQWVTLAQYDSWNNDYKNYLDRRKKKWVHMMNEMGLPSYKPTQFPPKNDKVKRYIRKGIPPEWRGDAWWFYAGGQDALDKNPGVYQALVDRAEQGEVTDSDREHIERDLNRTFPDNFKFKPDPPATLSPVPLSRSTPVSPLTPGTPSSPTNPETKMIRSLRRVLQAFALYNPKIGYCQSMNFLAGHILIFMKGNEEKSFHMLVILLTDHLPGTHGVALEGANVDIGVLMTSLKEAMPALWAKLDDREEKDRAVANADMRKSTGLPTVSLATTAWFMSCFVSTLPVETTCRVWDCLFYEGTKTLFRVALGIFWLGEIEIRRTTDHMEAFQVVQSLPRRLIDANSVMDAALKTKGLLSQEAVARLREERRGLYQRERDKVIATMPAPGQLPAPPPIPQDDLTEEEKERRARGFLRRMASTATIRTVSSEKEKERERQREEDPDKRPLSRGLSRATSRARMRRMKSFKA